MPPSQRSVSVGNIPDLAREPLCRHQLTHVSCDNLRPLALRRPPPPPPPPRVASLQRAHSQAVMHYTTVPQSLITRSLGSRHQPTRSSLRHSRMLVLIRQGRVPRKFLPGVLSRSHHGLFLCLSQLVLGGLLITLAIWRMTLQDELFLFSDWPLYSGVPLLCSGWVDIWLISCCRYYYPGTLPSHQSVCPPVFPINTASILFSLMVSLVSAVFSLVAAISHSLHLVTLSSASCSAPLQSPPSWPAQSCLCLSESQLWQQGELVYPGTSCTDLLAIQPPLLLSLALLNSLGTITSLTFMVLLSCSKHNITFRNWRRIKKTEQAGRIGQRVTVR